MIIVITAYYVVGTALQALYHLILMPILFIYPHFIDKKTEGNRVYKLARGHRAKWYMTVSRAAMSNKNFL